MLNRNNDRPGLIKTFLAFISLLWKKIRIIGYILICMLLSIFLNKVEFNNILHNFINQIILSEHNIKNIENEYIGNFSPPEELVLLQQENMRLKSLLDFKNNLNTKVVVVRIIGKYEDVIGERFFINAGQDEGINVGATIFNENGLIGQIIEVYKNYSRAMTLHDPHSRIPVLLGNSAIHGIAVGGEHKNQWLLLKYIKENGLITIPDIAVTAGNGLCAPPNIMVGSLVFHNGNYYIIPRAKAELMRYAFVNIY